MAMDSSRIAGRIGRKLHPGEGTMQLVLERPEVLEYMARTAFGKAKGLVGTEAVEAWATLAEGERTQWIERTFETLAAGARLHDETRPPDDPAPDGGGGEPINATEPDMPQARVA